MIRIFIAAGIGHQTDVQHRCYDRTATVGEMRTTVKNTPDSTPIILKHGGGNTAITAIRTDGRESLTLIAAPLESWAKIERIQKETLTAGELRRAFKCLPDGCKVVVKYKEGGTGAVYGIEKQTPPPPDTVKPAPKPEPEPEPQPLPYREVKPQRLTVYRLALIVGGMDGSGIRNKRAASLTVGDLRKELEGLPEELRVIAAHRAKSASLEEIRHFGEDLKIRPGNYSASGAQNAAVKSVTAGELLEALRGLPDEGRVIAGIGTENAAVYGIQKLTRPEL